MKLDYWARNLTKEVYEEWKSKYSDWKQGVKLFYGPIHRKNPKLMVLTYNPGGDSFSFQKDLTRFENGDFSPYPKHEYTHRDYTFAKNIRKLFSNNFDLLEESVALPIMFFRSKDTKLLKQRFQKDKRKEAEKFCLEKVKQIIEFLQPKKILIIGINTYEKLKKMIMLDMGEKNSEYSFYPTKKETLYIVSKWEKIPVLTIRHISGSRFSNKDKEKLNQQLSKFLTDK